MSAVDAAVRAAHDRLRPILMTSFAFILGTVPLLLATGAGAELRQALGTAVFFGMIGVTGFGLLFTPTFYVVCRALGDRIAPAARAATLVGRHARRAAAGRIREYEHDFASHSLAGRLLAGARRLRGRAELHCAGYAAGGLRPVSLCRVACALDRAGRGELVAAVPATRCSTG